MNMFLVSDSPTLHKNVVKKKKLSCKYYGFRTFVAKFCSRHFHTFSAKYFGLGSRLRKLFRFLDVCT